MTSLWNVTFPNDAPRLMTMYSLAEPPPLPPPPPPPPAAPKATPVDQVKQVVRHELVAPTIIPDTIPEVAPVEAAPQVAEATGVEGGIEGGVEGGVLGGDLKGIQGGDLGGEPESIPVIAPPDNGRVVVPRDATLRMHALSKTFPMYPENARIRGWEDDVVVRYVIGTDGKVKEVTILHSSGRKIFDEATVNAIRFWRFRPMIKDGKAVEVVHELTIKYRLNA